MIFQLFKVFAKIGAFTLGGGYAMVPLIQSEVVDKKQWIEKDEFVDILAVAQSTPGALAINMASFIGYRKKGILGAVSATLGCILPSFLSILFIAMFFVRFMDREIVKKAFMGIRPAVAALIAFSVFKIAKTSRIKSVWYLVSVGAFAAVGFLKLDPIFVILISAFTGIIFAKRGE
ncbi:chromate transporter [Fervidicella metallireducens AeB]|uniref:Chromate transporter n=1 Tax=Fervidicella metallireducens AeB TaxID=1403537 RepID=A0A017RYF3_9CLOT|nr:chromate transporter [Fervidicella metallireducens]EYE89813.1 chromate transporter [Fervidicella metallireducens AeB]